MKKSSLGIIGIICALLTGFSGSVKAQNVWTQHNDQARTGWYPYETTLNTTNVNKNTFGFSFNHITDDKVVSQPLVVMHVNIPGKGFKNIVYVTTLNNTIYAYDADVNATPYWTQNFTNKIAPSPGAACTNCRPAMSSDIHPSLCFTIYPDFSGNMGIVGTPVIDTAAGVMYFVTKIVNQNDGPIDNHTFVPNTFDEYKYTKTGFHQYLHAIDITTGVDLSNSPVEITATATGTGDGQTPANSGVISFEPRRQFNRAGLVLNNGILYIAFAAHCDFVPSHGWILSYNPGTLTQLHAYNATPNEGRGGIWMSGTAPAVDAAGNIYFTTGNSLEQDAIDGGMETHFFPTLPSTPANRGESVVKLTPDLQIASFFTPFDYIALNDADKDFPMQVMLLPGTNLAMTGNKDDSIYIMDQTNLGGFSATKNNVVQSIFVQSGTTMHSTFAYFGGPTPYAYQYSENSPLRAYPVSPAGLGASITNTTILGPSGGSGGYLSVSSNGSDPTTGVLWAYQAINGCNANGTTCPGTLHAVNASDVTKELWNSDMITADKIGTFNKMSCPTIALGKVYVAANNNQLNVYGLKVNTSCTTNVALGKPATALTFATGFPPNNVTDGNPSSSWKPVTNHNVDSIYVDLQGSYDICKIIIDWSTNGFGKDFDIKISTDAIHWTIVKSVRGNTVVTPTEFDGAVTARYVSMVGITIGTPTGYSIDEFQIFGTPSVTCLPPTNLNATTGAVTTIFTNQTPPAPAAQDVALELGVQFRSSISGFITGVRFYKGTGSTNGADVGELYSGTGTRLAQANFGTESASGWQTVIFSTPIAVTAGTTYVAAYYNPTGWYAADDNGLATAITNGNLTALANGGVYKPGSGPVFPTLTFASSNYFVDPIFSTLDPSTENLTWDANPNATQYLIQYRPNLSVSWINRTSNTNSLNISALTCGTEYFYSVQANCGATQSAVTQASFTSANCGTSTCDILPTRWFNLDLGDIGVAGSTCKNGTVYTVTGSGDISSTADAFQYVYTSNDIADYDLIGRIIQQDAVSASNKIGVMVRDSLSNTSRFAFMASVNNGTSFIFEYRSVAGGPVTIINLPGHAFPYWVKISKSGTLYQGFTSSDGISWVPAGSAVDLHFGTDPTNVPHYGMAAASANNTILSTGKIDNFNLAGSTPLPILLLSFTANNINNDHVLVSWSTSMEHLVDHYEIQRSADNTSFQTIANVKAVGESQTTQYYSVNDNNPAGGINYYRLKEVDRDGNFYISPVVSVKFNEPEGLEIYPNPAGNYTNIISQRYPIVDVNLYDVTGKLIRAIHPSGVQTSLQFNTADLSKGVYIISVKTTVITYRQKLFKQ
jgi:hypothetical protein